MKRVPGGMNSVMAIQRRCRSVSARSGPGARSMQQVAPKLVSIGRAGRARTGADLQVAGLAGIASPLADRRASTSTSASCDSFRVGIGLSPSSSVDRRAGSRCRARFSTATGIGGPPGWRAITNTVSRRAAHARGELRVQRDLHGQAATRRLAGAGTAPAAAAGRPRCGRRRSARAAWPRWRARPAASSGSQVCGGLGRSGRAWRWAMPRNQRARWCAGCAASARCSIATRLRVEAAFAARPWRAPRRLRPADRRRRVPAARRAVEGVARTRPALLRRHRRWPSRRQPSIWLGSRSSSASQLDDGVAERAPARVRCAGSSAGGRTDQHGTGRPATQARLSTSTPPSAAARRATAGAARTPARPAPARPRQSRNAVITTPVRRWRSVRRRRRLAGANAGCARRTHAPAHDAATTARQQQDQRGPNHSSQVLRLDLRAVQHELAVARDQELLDLARRCLPWRISASTSRRRSWAICALESASDWFWHITQRSSATSAWKRRFLGGVAELQRRGSPAGCAMRPRARPAAAAGRAARRASWSVRRTAGSAHRALLDLCQLRQQLRRR